MKIFSKLNRFRYMRTKFWFDYEKQIIQQLLSEELLKDLHEIIEDQFNHLYEAYRSTDPDIIEADYAFSTDKFWDYNKEFRLCIFKANEATGEVHFGGGMLGGIKVKPYNHIRDLKKLSLSSITLEKIEIKRIDITNLPKVNGWVKSLEDSGLLKRLEEPKEIDYSVEEKLLHKDYKKLFQACSSASMIINKEEFYFLEPDEISIVENSYIPILDLRDLGGLAVDIETSKIMYIHDELVWSEKDLAKSIKRLFSQLS